MPERETASLLGLFRLVRTPSVAGNMQGSRRSLARRHPLAALSDVRGLREAGESLRPS